MITVHKDCRGSWMAEDHIDLGNNQQLTILTMKRYNGIVSTTAQVGRVEGDVVSFYPFSDYNAVLVSDRDMRCTAKNVATAHGEIMSTIDQIKAEALAFYAAKKSTIV
jgi:hypothetical protein